MTVGQGAGEEIPDAPASPQLKPIAHSREETAGILAKALVIILASTITIPLVWYFVVEATGVATPTEKQQAFKNVSGYVVTVIASITTLLGVAFGFYYSDKRHREG